MNRQQRRGSLARVRKDIRDGRWTPFERVHGAETHPMAVHGLTRAYRNSLYSVQVFEQSSAVWYGIRRHDGQPSHDWQHFQQIKNELAGPEAEVYEVYPPESLVVDQANMYWLVLPLRPARTLADLFPMRGGNA